jgi:hypothetical protein
MFMPSHTLLNRMTKHLNIIQQVRILSIKEDQINS